MIRTRTLGLAGLTATLVACGGHGGSSRPASTVAGATSAPPGSSSAPPVLGPAPGPGPGPGPGPAPGVAGPIDLAAGPQNPAPARLAAGVQAIALQASLRASAAATVNEVTVVAQGTGAGDLREVVLAEDSDRNGLFDPARDRTIGTLSAAPFRFGSAALALAGGQEGLLLVATSFRPGTAAGRSVSLQVEARGVVATDAMGASLTVRGGAVGASLTVRGPNTPGTWTQVAPLPTPRTDLAAVALLPGTLHAIGGAVAGAPVGLHEVYVAGLDRWVTRAPLLSPRSGHAAAELGGKVYVVGGQLGASVLPSAEEWDPATDTWRAIAPLPVPLRDCAAAGYQGELWVTGGTSGGTPSRSSWVWSPATNTWRSGPGVGTPSRALTVAGGWLVIFEDPSQVYWGPGGPGSTLPAAGAFAQSATVLWDFARDGRAATAGAILPRAYLVGGQRNGVPVAELRSIDATIIFAGGAPLTHPSPSVARTAFAAAGLGDRLWVLGGSDAAGAPVAAVEEWTP